MNKRHALLRPEDDVLVAVAWLIVIALLVVAIDNGAGWVLDLF